MDLRKFKVTLATGVFDVEAHDVIVTEGCVLFINLNEEDETTKTVALFNANFVQAVMEVTK